VNPILYKREDAEACWRELRAPLLMLVGEESDILAKLGADGNGAGISLDIPHIGNCPGRGRGTYASHIERPDLVAPLVEAFLDAH